MTDQAYKSMSSKLNMSFAHIWPNLWHNYVGRLRKPKIKDVELAPTPKIRSPKITSKVYYFTWHARVSSKITHPIKIELSSSEKEVET